MEDIEIIKKIVVVGDSGVGKTSLLMKYMGFGMPTENSNLQVFLLHQHKKIINGKTIQLDLYDIDVKERFDKEEYRITTYDKTDVLLICFSLEDPASFENVRAKWYPEITRN